jgi:Zn-dependent metalloprotease
MTRFKNTHAFTLLTASLIAAPAFAQAPTAALRHAEAAESKLMSMRASLGLDETHSFARKNVHMDEKGQTHARFQQRFNGLRVWGGEVITHTDAEGTELPMTRSLHSGIQINAVPAMSSEDALATAHFDLLPKGAYVRAPQTELVIYPETRLARRAGVAGDDATAFENRVVRYRLAYHVHTELQNGAAETKHTDYLIDAHTGAVIKNWSSLNTAGVVGTGKSQWYGNVNLNTNSTASGFEMRDTTRGSGGTFGNNITTNLNNGTSGNGAIFTDADNTWGDGAQYQGTASNENAKTAAADAHRGLQATWDFYKNVFGRNGIDNTGKATYSRMHYSTNYDNAFWDDGCFCMTYGDGAPGGSVGEADLDTAGHEMTHGVTANSAGLIYSGESGGLNESTSDIFGTCVEFYILGGSGTGTTVPDSPGTGAKTANYTMFEQSFSNGTTPLRYMYKPSKDGNSKDAWYSGIGSIDVHFSSGPMNRAWYFMARGATTTGDTSTTLLPSGMSGVGNDKAARIWYRALTSYLTASSDYAAARTAAISAATDLYGANSPEVAAVQNAFHGINVGAAAGGGTTTAPSITSQPASVSVAAGSTASFSVTASGTAPLSYQWRKNGTNISGATSASYTTPATASADNGATFSVVVSNSAGSVTSNNATLTVTTSGGGGSNEVEPNNSFAQAQAVTNGTTISGTLGSSTDADYFKITLPAGATISAVLTPNGSSDYDLYVYNSNQTQIGASENGTGAVDSVSVKNTGTSAFTRYVKVIYYAGATGTGGTYTLKISY